MLLPGAVAKVGGGARETKATRWEGGVSSKDLLLI
jgi:hypothetical protein